MRSHSSTSSSELAATGRGRAAWPWLLALVLAIELAIALGAPRFMDMIPLIYREKLARAAHGPALDVLVLGDSQAMVSLPPAKLAAFLPPGTRTWNGALPSAGPAGAERVLRAHLDAHPAPRLVVVGFTVPILEDNPPRFLAYEVRHLLDPAGVAEEAWIARDPYFLMSWAATRLPSYRWRDDLPEAVLTLYLDAVPSARGFFQRRAGLGDAPNDQWRFRFRHLARAERNATIRRELEENAGWRYWKETAVGPAERLPEGLNFAPRPFVPSRNSMQALSRLFALAVTSGSRVLVAPLAIPAARLRSIREGGGGERFDAAWREAVASVPGVLAPDRFALPYPNRFFSDVNHVGMDGVERYVAEIGPLVTAALEGAALPPLPEETPSAVR